MSNDTPVAGWYPNPDGTGGLRWWSGVGWTEYTRTTGEQGPEPPAVSAWTPQPAAPTPGTPAEPNALGQQTAPLAGYPAYTPPPKQPLTSSGMRPLSGLFSDIGRITGRAWFPILGTSLIIWGLISAIYSTALFALVDLTALQRGFDLISVSIETNPDTGLPTDDAEISGAFRDAFQALSPAGWAVLGIVLALLLMLAATIQIAAVNRLAMDAAAGQRVSWGAGWKSGFRAGPRLFGYYLLLSLLATLVIGLGTVAVVLLWAVSPAVSVALAVLGFLALIVVSVWLTGRLIPALAQVVVGPRALSWSWTHTKGKFWAVLGRYLLWSLAASVIVNVIVTVLSIPVSLIFLGQASSATAGSAPLGASIVLSLLTMPLSMALTAITTIGIVPIWRDLTDHPVYRSIDDAGLPIPPQSLPNAGQPV